MEKHTVHALIVQLTHVNCYPQEQSSDLEATQLEQHLMIELPGDKDVDCVVRGFVP